MNQAPVNIKVRQACIDDAAVIVEFNLAMALETENLSLDEEVLNKGVVAVFEKPNRGEYLVAEIDGRVVGSLLVTAEWSDWRNSQVAWIHSLYVLPQYRGRGAFRQMFKTIEKRIEKEEFAGVRLYADKTNVSACEIYKKLKMDNEHYLMFEKMK